MAVNIANAISAYAKTAGAKEGAGPREVPEVGGEFADMVRSATDEAVSTLKHGEAVSMQSMADKADLTDVVLAVTNAEVTLKTVVAIRDRVIQAYQEIIRMPL